MEPEWISRILTADRLIDSSRAQYATCLRYWEAWHSLRFGLPLPLANIPPAQVTDAAIKAFVDDHLPVVSNGHVGLLMDHDIDRRLRQSGLVRCRSCPSEATTLWRLEVLQSAHHRSALPFDSALKNTLTLQLQLEWIRAHATLAMVRDVPTGRDMVLRLRHACPDTRDGKRLAAMVTLLQFLTPKQLANLQFGELVPQYATIANQKVRCVEIHIGNPANRFQTVFAKPRIMFADADAVWLWACIRLFDEFGEGVENGPSNLPFLVRDCREGTSAEYKPVTARWITNCLRELALEVGIEQTLHFRKKRYWASLIRLRSQRESEYQQRLMAIAAGLGVRTRAAVYNILIRRSDPS